MYNPKPRLQKELSSLGYHCQQGSQAIFNEDQIPAITFRIDNNSVDTDLDNKISSQDIVVAVGVWTDDSPTASRILGEVEEKMRELGYRMVFSADIPNPDGSLFHISTRFSGYPLDAL
ncbi:hypothetical protein FWH13_01515 [Candidatus Saccharibacteria bacterium]|nr:hypothetical protein [Candidatus Saccharibacteria bacterium]